MMSQCMRLGALGLIVGIVITFVIVNAWWNREMKVRVADMSYNAHAAIQDVFESWQADKRKYEEA